MSEIPTISITKEFADDGDVSDCDMKDALTDIEDLDDGCNDERSLKVKRTKTAGSPGTTDIEDYNDSSSDQEEEKSYQYDHTLLLLSEFLEQGFTEVQDAASNKITTTTGHKQGTLFISYLNNDEDQGAITDCENYNSSGDELSIAGDAENEICLSNYFPEAEVIQIADKDIDIRQDDVDDGDESPLSVSEAGDFCDPNELSDSENFLMSDVDEALADKIRFLYNVEGKKPQPLATISVVPDIQEDTHTDVEGIDSGSDAEIADDGKLFVSTQAASKRASCTDIEDIDIGDTTGLIDDPQNVDASNIPAAVRELTIVKSDVSGKGVTKTMPLMEAFATGVDAEIDQGVTDIEEMSGDEDMYDTAINVIIEKLPDIYNAISKNKEIIKECTSDHSRYVSDAEPITDVEEIFIAGTVRRKKSTKARNQIKNKKLAQAKVQDAKANTDVEEFEVSDAESALKFAMSNILLVPSCSSGNKSPEIRTTDVEYLSGEDEQSVSEGEEANERLFQAVKEATCMSTETTIESIYQCGSPCKRPKAREIQPRPQQHQEELTSLDNNPNLTDVEDVNLPSDAEGEAEGGLSAFSYSRAETVSPNELQFALNDCSVSVVHDKCGSIFDIDKEKHHIKGLRDCADAHTDVEYIDDENNDPGKEKSPSSVQ